MSEMMLTVQTCGVDSDLERQNSVGSATMSFSPFAEETPNPAPVYRVIQLATQNAVLDVSGTLEPKLRLTQVALQRIWQSNRGLCNFRAASSAQSSIASTIVSDRQLASVIDEIASLLMTADEDEVRPTEYAYTTVFRVLSSAYTLARLDAPAHYRRLPRPSVSADDVGGIRVRWLYEGRDLRTNFAAHPELRSYIYYEAGARHGIDSLDGDTLAEKLRWLTPE
jgi:hypothetical protein